MTKQTEQKLQLELFRLATRSVDPRVLKMIQAMRARHPGLMAAIKPTKEA
jgi:hypothetical protein